MSLSRIAIVSSVLLTALVAFPGCKKLETSDGDSIGTSEDLLVTDSEADDEQEQSEEVTDDATSGASTEAEAEQGVDPDEDGRRRGGGWRCLALARGERRDENPKATPSPKSLRHAEQRMGRVRLHGR